MDSKTQSAANRAYEDFEPEFHWERDESRRTATLVVLVPGFKREELTVQLTSTPLIKINGEQPISDNKWRRIDKEFSIPSDCNVTEVTAKLERGQLYVKFPILSIEEAPKPQDGPKPQEAALKPREDKAEEAKANEVSTEKETPQKDKEFPKEREEKKKVRTGGDVETIAEAKTSKDDDEESKAQGPIQRTKTRVLDYTISLRPTSSYEEAVGELKKPKNMVNMILVILFVVALWIYVKNAFRSFLGGSKLQG